MYRIPVTDCEKNLYNIKLSIGEVCAVANKMQRAACIERIKCKQCIKNGNEVRAREYAGSILRNLIASTNYVKLSSRVKGFIHYLENTINQYGEQGNVEAITKSMQEALVTRNVTRASLLMDRFEKDLENMDVSNVAGGGTNNVNTILIPENEVNALIEEISHEAKQELTKPMTPSDVNSTSSYLSPVESMVVERTLNEDN